MPDIAFEGISNVASKSVSEFTLIDFAKIRKVSLA